MLSNFKLSAICEELHLQTKGTMVGFTYTYRKVLDAMAGKKEALSHEEVRLLKRIIKDAFEKAVEELNSIHSKHKK